MKIYTVYAYDSEQGRTLFFDFISLDAANAKYDELRAQSQVVRLRMTTGLTTLQEYNHARRSAYENLV